MRAILVEAIASKVVAQVTGNKAVLVIAAAPARETFPTAPVVAMLAVVVPAATASAISEFRTRLVVTTAAHSAEAARAAEMHAPVSRVAPPASEAVAEAVAGAVVVVAAVGDRHGES